MAQKWATEREMGPEHLKGAQTVRLRATERVARMETLLGGLMALLWAQKKGAVLGTASR